jgi:serine/threonine protein phosphatase PrpC
MEHARTITNLKFNAVSDRGQREYNEDSYLIDKGLNLFIVADGMGGHASGETASSLAVKCVRDTIYLRQDMINAFSLGEEDVSREDILTLMDHAIQDACSKIYDLARSEPKKRGMGTTLLSLLIAGRRAFIAHVGDSRLYLVRQGFLYQLTEDHSLINELRRMGREEEANSGKYKNAITRAVGVHENVQVDTLDLDVIPEDYFLLATDGLYSLLSSEEISSCIIESKFEATLGQLLALVKERQGQDNITGILVYVPEQDNIPERLKRELNLRVQGLRKMPFFEHLSYQELIRVMNRGRIKSYKKGVEIVTEGKEGEELFIILAGNALVKKGDNVIAELKQGDHFGEMAIVNCFLRSATVVADDEIKAFVIHRKEFFDLVRERPSTGVKILWSLLEVLARRLRTTSYELSLQK